jgi:phospholipase/lecithinase/hemolysin
MSIRRLSAASLLAASALSFAAPAQAQRVDNIVVFGDSYADDGNAFELAGINPVSTVVYTTGRFSGGTNYIDTLADILGATTENFAIGGAKTDNTNVNVGLPGFQTEVQAFLAGGLLPAFPTGDGLFDENDLLAISIGGNDSRAYELGGGLLAGAPAAATVAAANATFGLDLLVDAGAQNISFLAGDTGRLPEVQGRPVPALAASVRSSFSSTFNAAMQSTLAGYAADGVMVHYLDLNLVS